MKRTTLVLVSILVLVSMVPVGLRRHADGHPDQGSAHQHACAGSADGHQGPGSAHSHHGPGSGRDAVPPTATTAAVAPTATAVPPTATKAPAAPAATATPVPPLEGKAGVITVWHNYTGEYVKAIDAAVADYQKANPNVKIVVLPGLEPERRPQGRHSRQEGPRYRPLGQRHHRRQRPGRQHR